MDPWELSSQLQLRSVRPVPILLQSARGQHCRLPCGFKNRRTQLHGPLHAGREPFDHCFLGFLSRKAQVESKTLQVGKRMVVSLIVTRSVSEEEARKTATSIKHLRRFFLAYASGYDQTDQTDLPPKAGVSMSEASTDKTIEVKFSPVFAWMLIIFAGSFVLIGIFLMTPFSPRQNILLGIGIVIAAVAGIFGGRYWLRHLPVMLRLGPEGLE